MSRPLRLQQAGLTYHVMSRGNNKMPIFLDDLDYARFIEILAIVVERFALDSYLFCLMPNHSHLVFRTTLPNLSRATRHLNGTYAQWWNKRHARMGHVYQGRFKAQIVEESVYLLRLCRYVLLNPVRGRIARRPDDWPWSSYAALAGRATTCVDVTALVRAIDPDHGTGVRGRLLEFVDGEVDDEMAVFVRSDQRVIGTEAFASQFTARARRASREVPERERRIGAPPLGALLADAVRRGEGLLGGVRDAHAALYRVDEIAACAGLSPRVVARMVDGDSRLTGRTRTALQPTYVAGQSTDASHSATSPHL
jgi:REP element-mobilizing transposase RayT